MASLLRVLAAEAVGTFFLTFVAAGANVIDAVSGGTVGHVGRYLSPGLIVTAMIYSLSGVSGAHLNPAVTLAFVLRRTFPARKAIGYIAVQLAGATLAALTIASTFGTRIAHGVTHSTVAAAAGTIVVWEGLLTLLLVFVILSTAQEKALVGKNAAIAIGLTVAACGLFASPVTGASMNPARSFGPAAVAGEWSSLWPYIAGPLAGAVIAALLVQLVHGTYRDAERDVAQGSA